MFENIMNFFKKWGQKENKVVSNSKEAAKERLHLVLMQDRANVSADFLELMKQEIIEVIKKYIDVDESAIDVRLTNKENGDGTNGAPALYANIPILNIKNEARKVEVKHGETKKEENKKVEQERKNEKEDNQQKDQKEEKEKQEVKKDKKKEVKKKAQEEVEAVKEKTKEEKSKNNQAKEKIKSEN